MPQNSVISLVQTRDGYLWLGTGSGLARFDGSRFRSFEDTDVPGLNGKIIRLFEDSRGGLWVGTENAGVFLISPEGKVTSVAVGKGPAEGPLTAICEDRAGGIWLRTAARGQVFRTWDGNLRPLVENSVALASDNSGLIWVGTPDGRLAGLGPIENTSPSAIPVPVDIPVGKLDFLLRSRTGGYWRFAQGRIQKCRADRVEKDLGQFPWDPSSPVLAACEDNEANLVVGVWGDGVYWFDSSGKANHLDGLRPYIWALTVDREDNLWVGTDGGGLSRVKRLSFDVLEGTQDSAVQSVCEAAKGGLWIGYNDKRVDRWNGQALQQFTSFSVSVPRSFLQVQTVFEDKNEQLWAGTLKAGFQDLCLFNLVKDKFVPASLGSSPRAEAAALASDLSAIFQDRHGVIWVGTQTGLERWDGHSWKLFGVAQGLSSPKVRAVAEDADGNLWVGTEGGGLNCLRDGAFTSYRKQRKDGLPSDDISCICVDTNGVIWLGTPGGLARFANGKFTRYTTREGLVSNKVGYLIEDGLGFLWLGSNAGLMRVSKSDLNDFANGKLTTVPCRAFGKPDGLPTAECTSGAHQPGPCRTRDGKLWFPTISGLVVLDPLLLTRNTNPPPVVIDAVRVDGELQTSDALRAPAPATVTVPAGKESLEIDFASLNLSAPDKVLFRYRLEGHETAWTEWDNLAKVRYPRLPPGNYRFHVVACNEDRVVNETGAYLAVIVQPPFWRKPWFIVVVSLGLLGMVVGSVYYVSTTKLQRQLAVLREHEALEKERARIARDLHDQLGANLTQVALLGEMAETDKNLPDEVESHARQISQTARETTHALDEIVWTVNPSNDTLDGLINYICKYAQEYLALANLRYRLEVPSQLPATPISPELRHNVFLVAKEAVNNIVKHSRASSAWLRLQLQPDRFVLEIEDDGKGIPAGAENKGRNGLRNMRKRMEDIGGQFELGARAEGGGTRIRLIAPLQSRPA